jgi:inhibitor of KinA sporulation pathway (predicted exonuclease)
MTIDKFFNLCEEISGVKKPKFTLPIKIAYPISKFVEELFYRLKKHSPIPDPIVLEMASHNWDIQSLFCEEVNYNLTDSKIILRDTINWIKEFNRY